MTLEEKCIVCGAKKGEPCHSVIDGGPRQPHSGRSESVYCRRCGRAAPVNHDCGRNR